MKEGSQTLTLEDEGGWSTSHKCSCQLVHNQDVIQELPQNDTTADPIEVIQKTETLIELAYLLQSRGVHSRGEVSSNNTAHTCAPLVSLLKNGAPEQFVCPALDGNETHVIKTTIHLSGDNNIYDVTVINPKGAEIKVSIGLRGMNALLFIDM